MKPRHKKTPTWTLFALLLAARVLLVLPGCLLNSPELDPLSQDFYDYARLIMSPQEIDIFRHLPDADSRQEFIIDFWDKHDPDPFTEENEYKTAFYRRIEEANRYFRSEGIPGWKTDRGRIYIYLGQPDRIEQRPFMRDPEIKGLIWWGYLDYRFGVWFVDRRGDGQYSIYEYSSTRGESLNEVLQRVHDNQMRNKGEDFGNRYLDFKLKFDKENDIFLLSIPIEDMVFIEEKGYLKAELDFIFYLYRRRVNWQRKFQKTRRFEKPQRDVLKMRHMEFQFPYRLSNGDYYVDVVVMGDRGVGKTRKIFQIKVF
jgi:GWxTD domain-containing protein